MSNRFFGKDEKLLSEEEKLALAAEMRSRRKNGNGLKGRSRPDAQAFHTDNFELNSSKNGKKSIGLAKYSNEHVKCIFICARDLYPSKRAYGESQIYYVAFLSDSNRFSFEEFRDSPSKTVKNKDNIAGYRVQKFDRMFSQKNIDKDTDVFICMDGIRYKQYFFLQVKMMCHFVGTFLRKTTKATILKKMIHDYEIFKNKAIYKNCSSYSREKLNSTLLLVYKFLVENNLCPWMTEEKRTLALSLSKYKKYSFVLADVGLFYAIILKYSRMISKA